MSKMKSTVEHFLANALDSASPNMQMLLDLHSSSPWKENDREWFASNPRRSFRLRRLMPGEFPGIFRDGSTYCVVRQIKPSFREKLLASDNSGGGTWLDSVPDVEEVHLAIWQLLDSAGGNKDVPVHKIKEFSFKLIEAAKQAGSQQ